MVNEQNYEKSIKLLQELFYNMIIDKQKEFFTKEIRNIKIKYLNDIKKK